MNWTKASAIAEILSSIAILATLVCLAIEIQQNADATRANTRQTMLMSDQQFLELLIESPELHLSWHKPGLSNEEKVRLSFFLITQLRMRENNWLQYRSGIVDENTWNSYSGSLKAIFTGPQPRAW